MGKSGVKNNWEIKNLGEFIKLKYGFSLPEKDRVHGKIPVYGSSGIVGHHNTSSVKGPGIIVGRKGNVGAISFSNDDFWPIDTAYYIEENKGFYDIKFLFFLLRTLSLNTFDTAAAVPGLSRDSFYNIETKIPSLPIQQKIASVLSAYDDLIEVNERKIKILEEMARLIYKEWFVKFRFPLARRSHSEGGGYKKAKMVESELGMIPEGWEICQLASLGKVITGKTPSTKDIENFGGYMPFITIPDMHNKVFIIETERYLSEKGLNTQSSKTLPRNAICVSCIATMGLVVITTENSQTNQQINSIILEDLSILEYLFFVLKFLRSKITLYGSSGTAANILNKDKFSRLRIVKPKNEIIKQFHYIVEPIFKQIENIMKQNFILRQTRDMLLPKLISGEIDVSDLEIGLV